MLEDVDMSIQRRIYIVDSHAIGEPKRIVFGWMPKMLGNI